MNFSKLTSYLTDMCWNGQGTRASQNQIAAGFIFWKKNQNTEQVAPVISKIPNKQQISWKNWWLIRRLFDFFQFSWKFIVILKNRLFDFWEPWIWTLRSTLITIGVCFQCWADKFYFVDIFQFQLFAYLLSNSSGYYYCFKKSTCNILSKDNQKKLSNAKF